MYAWPHVQAADPAPLARSCRACHGGFVQRSPLLAPSALECGCCHVCARELRYLSTGACGCYVAFFPLCSTATRK